MAVDAKRGALLPRVFYGWWITLAAFLNLFFTVGIVFYGFPVFYTSLVDSLGFTRSQVTEGIFLGFLIVVPFCVFFGALIDRFGARRIIQIGLFLVGLPLVGMGWMTKLWHYFALSVVEVVGYILAGPIPNQVLISNWFQAKRGRAMGYAYVGLGLGGAVTPVLIQQLIEHFGWRRAFQIAGALIILVLFPVSQLMTRSAPSELGLTPDGSSGPAAAPPASAADIWNALRAANFWLILAGSTLIIGAIGTVIQQFVLFLRDQGYSIAQASRILSVLLLSGLAGRIIVGYLADRFQKKNTMALFYLVLALTIPLLFLARQAAVAWAFALAFGFAMGADYLLIPLVTAECFGLNSLGKLLSLIIMANSLGQWLGPWLAGKVFDATRSYDLAWGLVTVAGVLGASAIYFIHPARNTGAAE